MINQNLILDQYNKLNLTSPHFSDPSESHQTNQSFFSNLNQNNHNNMSLISMDTSDRGLINSSFSNTLGNYDQHEIKYNMNVDTNAAISWSVPTMKDDYIKYFPCLQNQPPQPHGISLLSTTPNLPFQAYHYHNQHTPINLPSCSSIPMYLLFHTAHPSLLINHGTTSPKLDYKQSSSLSNSPIDQTIHSESKENINYQPKSPTYSSNNQHGIRCMTLNSKCESSQIENQESKSRSLIQNQNQFNQLNQNQSILIQHQNQPQTQPSPPGSPLFSPFQSHLSDSFNPSLDQSHSNRNGMGSWTCVNPIPAHLGVGAGAGCTAEISRTNRMKRNLKNLTNSTNSKQGPIIFSENGGKISHDSLDDLCSSDDNSLGNFTKDGSISITSLNPSQSNSSSLSNAIFSDITDLLTLPQKEAALKLGISESMLCKRFKQRTPRKWPYRSLRKIQKNISSLEEIRSSRNLEKEEETRLKNLIHQRNECLAPVKIFMHKPSTTTTMTLSNNSSNMVDQKNTQECLNVISIASKATNKSNSTKEDYELEAVETLAEFSSIAFTHATDPLANPPPN